MHNPLFSWRPGGAPPYWLRDMKDRDPALEVEHLRRMRELELAVQAATKLRTETQTEKGIT